MANTPSHNDIASTYGPLGLSALAILLIAIAAFIHSIDWNLAIDAMGFILGGNSLIGAVRWQAAPGLLADIQDIIKQLSNHIQVLQSQQQQASTTDTPTLPQAS